jgi:hypothetical protein
MNELERIEKAKAQYKARQSAGKKKSKPLLGKVECSCGNTIKLFNHKTEVKCFNKRCGKFYKKVNGEWKLKASVRQEKVSKPTTAKPNK